MVGKMHYIVDFNWELSRQDAAIILPTQDYLFLVHSTGNSVDIMANSASFSCWFCGRIMQKHPKSSWYFCLKEMNIKSSWCKVNSLFLLN